MKDVQMPLAGGEQRIPVLTPVVHCCAMTVLVFFRSNFGFNFLRPRSVFFAFSWAFVLFAIYAWNEPTVWSAYRLVCEFGVAATAFYWIHLSVAFANEWRQNWRHDRYSGDSHILSILRLAGVPPTARLEGNIHLWAEPAIVLFCAAILRIGWNELHLSKWLFYAAGCFWFKEVLNRWFGLRYLKKQKDIFDDAAATVEPAAPTAEHGPVKATRKERVRRTRNTSDADETARERHFAEILRLRAPYVMEKAEENYRTLIRMEHPDATGEDSPEANARAASLNEAIEFFREYLAG
jgi:hypothetical protein